MTGSCTATQEYTRGVRYSRRLVEAAVNVRRRWTPLCNVSLQLASRILTARIVFRDCSGEGVRCPFLAGGVCGYEYSSDG